jgi:LPXTG-motif cell wall-anchored protein
MKKFLPNFALVILMSVAPGLPASAETTPGSWGQPALAVPLLVNSEGSASINDVYCSSVGNCVAGGHFSDGTELVFTDEFGNETYLLHSQAFVISQANGVWGEYLLAVPLSANAGNQASVVSVHCSSAGNCVAGGYYEDANGSQAYVISQTNGVWGEFQLAVSLAINSGNYAGVNSVHCSSAGNCVAGGYYEDANGGQAFVITQTNGVWGEAQLVVPLAINTGNLASVVSVDCTSAGNCVAGGSYKDANGSQAFVISQTNGIWGDVQLAVPLATNTGNTAYVLDISCASAGNCVAVGYYQDSNGGTQAFVISQTNGVWGESQLGVPLATNIGQTAALQSVDCSTAGNCIAGGYYGDGTDFTTEDGAGGRTQAFTISQVDGVWGSPRMVFSQTEAALYTSSTNSVSCSSAGNCVAGGNHLDSAGDLQAFVATQTNGVWGNWQLAVPLAVNAGNQASTNSVSCSSDGGCLAGGYYADVAGSSQAFLTSYTPAKPAVVASPVVTAKPSTLAKTGVDFEWLLFVGILSAIAGSGFLAFSRRKRIW